MAPSLLVDETVYLEQMGLPVSNPTNQANGNPEVQHRVLLNAISQVPGTRSAMVQASAELRQRLA
jgi:hypothetical protein